MRPQPELFESSDPIRIPGASYVPEFVSPAVEQTLIAQIDSGSWSHEFARRRQHFGMDYSKPNAGPRIPLPRWINEIAERIVAAGLFSTMPAQALVNEYLPGQGISAHKDYAPFEEVASLSLVSGCLMELAKPATRLIHMIWLEPRSLLVLTGEARYEWTHAIRPRLNDVVSGQKIARQRRLSLTFRTIPD